VVKQFGGIPGMPAQAMTQQVIISNLSIWKFFYAIEIMLARIYVLLEPL